MKAGDRLVDDLADAILDGTPIDWAAAESSAEAAARPLVRHLKVLAAIASVHRGTPAIASILSEQSQSLAERNDGDALEHWGHLRILEPVGSGASGKVYRAWDTRLDREVALKLVPAARDSDDRTSSGIIHEGRLLARVRHPNVVTIHGAEQIGEWIGLWMEFVRGHTLEQLLQRQTVFGADEVIAVGLELCRAVSAVHGAGLLHRDIKAQNVMRAEDGRIVLMDFGTGREREDDAASDLAGTPLYLAPEVLQGQPATVRSDIYSLGVLLYHLVSGSYPVHARTVREVRRAHEQGKRTAVWTARRDVPPKLARVIERAIDPRPERRYDSVEALSADLAVLRPRPRIVRLAYAAGVAAAIVLVAALGWEVAGRQVGFSRTPSALIAGFAGLSAPPPVPNLQNAMQVTFALDVESYPTWSPDGTRLAYQAGKVGWYYVGDHDIWVAHIGGGEPVNLTKGHPANDRMPSWSPDGGEIAFFSDRDDGWGVYSVPATGGSPRLILPLPGMDNLSWSAPQWSRDGSRLFVSARQAGENVVIILSLVSLETIRVPLPDHGGNVCFDLSVSPDGRRFAYVEGGSGETEVTRLWTIAASGGESVPLTDGRTNVWSPTWSTDGRTIFYVSNRGRSMDLWQQAVAPDGQAVGQPLVVTQGLGIRSAAFSPDRARLAYTRGGRVSNVWRVPILSERPATWADAVQLTSERAFIEFVDASPDGNRLAVSSDRRGNQDLWLLSAEGGVMTPLTADPTPDWAPRWSPDGSEIAFYSYRSGNRDIWIIPSGGGPARQLTAHPAQDRNPRWSPEGNQLLFHSSRPEGRGWWTVDAKGGEGRFLMSSGDSGDDGGDWSPDGRSLVLSSQHRLYRVPMGGGEPVALPSTAERPFSPRFSRDGRSIYYVVVTGDRRNHDLWQLSLANGRTSRLTQLEGRRGRLGYVFSADAHYLYFTWGEDDGDIWVMDVAAASSG